MQTSVRKKHYFKRLLPQSKFDWKMYFSKTWPIIIGEILFCLNGFLDNFMVSHIPSGIDALTYANTYTGIIYTIFFAIQGIAGMFVGQYYGKKNYDKVNQIMNLRIWMYLVISVVFAIVCWSMPTNLIYFVGGRQINSAALNEARMYLMLICISWIITSFNFNTNMQLNETGHSNLAFVSACLTLISNATINAISLYAFKGKAYYAAFGSIISAFVCLASDSLLTYYKDRPIFVNLFKIHIISRPIAKQILKRIPAMLITIAAMITIPIRMIIWSRAYPDSLIEGSGIRAAWMGINAVTILGLVESLASIASAITSACSSNVSYFVAGNLGKNNFEEAEKHAYALRGFHAIMGACMSALMIGVVFGIAYSPATSRGSKEAIDANVKIYLEKGAFNSILNNSISTSWLNSNIVNEAQKVYNHDLTTWTNGIPNKIQLENFLNKSEIKNLVSEMKFKTGESFRQIFIYCCLTFILINPIWCWFYTAAALPGAGGRNMVGSITMLSAHWLSFIWLIILSFGIIIPLRNKGTYISLELSYFAFFAIDFLRLIIFETVAAKTDWKRNITDENTKQIAAIAPCNSK
ncbi:MATE family efflux transporter [Mycoplasma enhydrae]|uniref:MATE family efflux transporter n=1 Tax=Mycoplasma enhydrae TaxID=2499220 RepID=UPI0021E929F0|nr:MATE family efflux transporter [Mycoplasma enhydrae]MCV3753297.1 MATE family efflux transporter [Mycoplasma enhydrae]